MIICDTREKTNQHILNYFKKRGIEYVEHVLDTGDYINTENPTVCVERKKDLNELVTNFYSKKETKNGTRIIKEMKRAKEQGIKMYVLCEHGKGIRSIKDVAKFKSKNSRVTGKQLMEKLYLMHISYGVEFLFCDGRSTGKKILELLEYEK